MLTFIEAISLAGDRGKQNDDALGFAGKRAWVIDGATDLQETKLTRTASDAAWIAHAANARLHEARGASLKDAVRDASEAARAGFARLGATVAERWMSPIASLVMVEETAAGVSGLHLGDCRVFALDAAGDVFEGGPSAEKTDEETRLAAQQTDADKPLLQRTDTIAMLRRIRGGMNQDGAAWTFGLDAACADYAKVWSLTLKRPAHVLLMTDGFSCLTDKYGAYTSGGLVTAALTRGLQELGREIRGIESADDGAAKHPRFKKSDDATALLMRLS